MNEKEIISDIRRFSDECLKEKNINENIDEVSKLKVGEKELFKDSMIKELYEGYDISYGQLKAHSLLVLILTLESVGDTMYHSAQQILKKYK